MDVGHGQMPETQLGFGDASLQRGDTDVLLSTTIIESGLDIPTRTPSLWTAPIRSGWRNSINCAVASDGERPGRTPTFSATESYSPLEGQQRLEVIAENTQLGAGYSIAMRDLEIRGAGELLGTRQHGHIQAVGFHLYTRLLGRCGETDQKIGNVTNQWGEERWQGKIDIALSSLTQPISMPVNVDLPLAVGIPADYIADQDLRLRLYRRIADLRDETEIDALSSEFSDRFGKLPEMVENLFYQMRVKLRAERAGLSAINWESGQIVLRYPASKDDRDGQRLPDLGPGIRGGKNAYWCSFGKDEDWEEKLLDTLERFKSISL